MKALKSIAALALIVASSCLAPAQDMMKLKRAADKGNPNAMYALAKRLDEVGEYREAFTYLEKAESKGHTPATAMLAHYIEFRSRYFEAGDFDGADVSIYRRWIAFNLYQKAARKGNTHAMFRIGNYYLHSASFNLPDKVIKGYDKTCETRKISKVMGNIGYYYLGKWHIDKNERRAFSWYMRGVKKGDPECIFKVAELYKDGTGTKASAEKYIEYLNEAANRGYIPAMLTLSKIYRVGYPIEQNTAKADEWLVEALKKSPSTRDMDAIMNSQEAIESMISAYKGEVAGIAANDTKARYWENRLMSVKSKRTSERNYGGDLENTANKSYY